MISPQQKLLRKGILDTLSERKKYYWITLSCGLPVGHKNNQWNFRLVKDAPGGKEEYLGDFNEGDVCGGLKTLWRIMRDEIKSLNGVDITDEARE